MSDGAKPNYWIVVGSPENFARTGGARVHRSGAEVAAPQEGRAHEARRQDRLLHHRAQGVLSGSPPSSHRTTKVTSVSGRAATPKRRPRTIPFESTSRPTSILPVDDAVPGGTDRPADGVRRQMAGGQLDAGVSGQRARDRRVRLPPDPGRDRGGRARGSRCSPRMTAASRRLMRSHSTGCISASGQTAPSGGAGHCCRFWSRQSRTRVSPGGWRSWRLPAATAATTARRSTSIRVRCSTTRWTRARSARSWSAI